MKLGIVGLPNVGKSTLFNSLTKAGAESANYPFCTIDPNVGVVAVPDNRLKLLGDLYHSKKVTPAVIEFVDIAGLVKGASKGEGLGNQFLANIREVDAIVHVVRCFEDPNVIHVEGSVDPIRDIETINLELIFSDIEILERRIAKTSKSAFNDKSLAKEVEILKELKAILEDGKMASSYENDDEDVMAFVNSLNLLTCKPVIFAANVGEEDLADDGASNPHVAAVREYVAENNCEVFVICAQIEQEIAELDDDEKQEYLDALGLAESGLDMHHIKKENIGLIEVMGLAVLPSRLKQELFDLADGLVAHLPTAEYPESLQKHAAWAEEILAKHPELNADNVHLILQDEVGHVFAQVLADAGVYKLDEAGRAGFFRFLESVK